MPSGGLARAEVRRLIAWFDDKFYGEVARLIPMRKSTAGSWVTVPAAAGGYGNRTYRATQSGLHMEYLTFLEQRSWLAGEDITIADLTAGAHLSCLTLRAMCPGSHGRSCATGMRALNRDPVSARFWPIRSRACAHRPIMSISILGRMMQASPDDKADLLLGR